MIKDLVNSVTIHSANLL